MAIMGFYVYFWESSFPQNLDHSSLFLISIPTHLTAYSLGCLALSLFFLEGGGRWILAQILEGHIGGYIGEGTEPMTR
jgi:hypothetical protein